MSKRRNVLSCPSCQTKLLESSGTCNGVVLICPHCGASILVDIDEYGKMKLSFEPHYEVRKMTEFN